MFEGFSYWRNYLVILIPICSRFFLLTLFHFNSFTFHKILFYEHFHSVLVNIESIFFMVYDTTNCVYVLDYRKCLFLKKKGIILLCTEILSSDILFRWLMAHLETSFYPLCHIDRYFIRSPKLSLYDHIASVQYILHTIFLYRFFRLVRVNYGIEPNRLFFFFLYYSNNFLA